ncbi:3-oxoacyl-[acyl-carrier-protein] synthase III C-terminal domain-containing protein [Streptomyces roseifaciens]
MKFLAIEHSFPSRRVTNDHVLKKVREANAAHLTEAELATVEELVRACFAASGTTVRYHRAAGESASELATDAGRRALDASGLDALDIDLLLYVGIGRGVAEPASATTFQDLLGLRRATAFDILDACASWIRALHVADAFLRTGAYRNIMIVNAECNASDIYRYELRSLEEFAHWHPTLTIGEAATATILTAHRNGADEEEGFEASFRTWGEKRDLCFVPMANFDAYFGKEVDVAGTLRPLQFVSFGLSLMEFGTRKLVEHYRDLPQFEEFKADLVFGHSASDGAGRHVVEACGIDADKYRFDHRNHANTVSASVPVSMSEALKSGELAEGDRVLLMAASAGVTTALAKFTYHGR